MIKIETLYLWDKKNIVHFLFYLGILIAYMGSLHPWFMWSVGSIYVFIAAFFVGLALLVSYTMENPVFTRNDYLLPITVYIILSVYLQLVNSGNFFGFLSIAFHAVIFLALFKTERCNLPDLMTFLCKSMAFLLVVSIPVYVLYVLGFSLPCKNVQFQDGLYTFSNYYFFLLDDRSVMTIIPRFHSVFLEPGHLGTATVFLLLTQCGKWKKWYNIVLLTATLMSFSLAAYVLLTVVIFLHLWIKRKHFIGKLFGALIFLSAIVACSFYYNDGDNLLHDLIIMRLEINDGEMEGNNRVSDGFVVEYENFWNSSDIFLGRDMDKDIWGNSGYQVYIYENGLIGLFLVILFYYCSMKSGDNRRALITSMIVACLAFIVRGYPLWYNYYIPFFCLSYVTKSDLLYTEK